MSFRRRDTRTARRPSTRYARPSTGSGLALSEAKPSRRARSGRPRAIPPSAGASRGRSNRPLGSPIGCGVDVVELSRFQRAMKRGGRAFMRRIFTPAEEAYARARPRTRLLHLAGRFAAKEAVIKAMSQIDPTRVLTMSQVEVRNDRFGRPHIVLHDRRRGRIKVHASLSHVNSVAVASAIAIKR